MKNYLRNQRIGPAQGKGALQLLTCKELPSPRAAAAIADLIPGVTIGRLFLLPKRDEPLVDYPANRTGALVPARAVPVLAPEDSGCEVALAFEDGDLARPIILGVLRSHTPVPRCEATLDGERVALTASRELVLRCGRASITLTAAGKLLIEGEYVVSRSTGVNKLRGASVQIN